MPAGQDGSQTATIAAGGQLSTPIYLGGQIPYNLQLPPSGWTASNINFYGSVDGVTFAPLYTADAGTEALYTLTSTGTGGRVYALNPNVFAGLRAIKVNAVTVQVGASTIQVGLRDAA